MNPLRYRVYYYDNETGMYYFQSRYYNPWDFRFINADLPEYAKEQKDNYAGTNLFTYCCNDPVNNSDPTGYCGKDYHRDWTISWIKSSDYSKGTLAKLKPYANKIGKYCRQLDIDYPSTYYATHMYNSTSKNWQYYHFNGNKKVLIHE